MTKWPSVEYGHIFCYFVERPGVYTRRQLMQWKSLEAYNYFQSGHVRKVQVWPLFTILYVNYSSVVLLFFHFYNHVKYNQHHHEICCALIDPTPQP